MLLLKDSHITLIYTIEKRANDVL